MADLQLRFFQIDLTAKADISTIVSTTPNKSWSNIDDLKVDSLAMPGNYATMEHNYTILDGKMSEFPDITTNKTWGVWSSLMSDGSGNFSTPPTLEIFFNEAHAAKGLTLYFYPHTDDFASKVSVTWYSTAASTNIIKSGQYTLTSNLGIVEEYVEGFKHIKISFLSTNIPYRYIKLYAVDYGVLRILNDDEINGCQILEEVDPISESISTNTLRTNIRTTSSIFSSVISQGYDPDMAQRQVLRVYRDNTHFGVFFLDQWDDPYQSGIEFNLSASDAMSVLDTNMFYGNVYTKKSVKELLNEIFEICFPTGLVKYSLDSAFSNSTVTGWIPMDTCGVALQHIAFALNAVVDKSRDGIVYIRKRPTSNFYNIPLESQYLRGVYEQLDSVVGVDVTSHTYVPDASADYQTIQDGMLDPGTYTFTFSQPMYGRQATIGLATRILFSGSNTLILDVLARDSVKIETKPYIDVKTIHSARLQSLYSTNKTVNRFENYTLVSSDIGQSLAQSILSYYEKNVRADNDIILNDITTGKVARLKTRGYDISGIIESLDINLRANKASAIIRGTVIRG